MSQIARAGLGLIALTTIAALFGSESAVTQEAICGQRPDIVAQLDGQFAESQKALGLIGNEAILEIYVSNHGSWTILTTDTKGTTCIVAAGEAWDDGSAHAAVMQGTFGEGV